MKFVLTSKEMKQVDQYVIDHGTSSLSLIKQAAKAIFNKIIFLFSKPKRILVVVGQGGNGADGYFVAKYLLEYGFDVDVLMQQEPTMEETKLAKESFPKSILTSFPNSFYDIIIDALFGIGFQGALEDKDITLIKQINQQSSYKISIDIPSGINGTTGKASPVAIQADVLIAIQYEKVGYYLQDGMDYFSKLEVVSYGKDEYPNTFMMRLEQEDISSFFPKRKRNSHKGTYQKTIIVGGSDSFCGAPYLSYSALCSLLGGSGYATLAIPEELYSVYALKNPEITYLKMSSKENKMIFNQEIIDKLLSYHTIVIGMGMGTSSEVYLILCYLLKHFKGTVVIDADGLNSLAAYGIQVLKEKTCQVVLTPHLLEFSRLIQEPLEKIEKEEIKLAKEFANEYQITLVLKSSTTFITDGVLDYINITGTAALAKAGSGDLLSGLMGGIISSTQANLTKQCAVACYIMGKAGELAEKEKGEYAVLARDVIRLIPEVMKANE